MKRLFLRELDPHVLLDDAGLGAIQSATVGNGVVERSYQ